MKSLREVNGLTPKFPLQKCIKLSGVTTLRFAHSFLPDPIDQTLGFPLFYLFDPTSEQSICREEGALVPSDQSFDLILFWLRLFVFLITTLNLSQSPTCGVTVESQVPESVEALSG
jgi:hypothetical protein